MRGRVALTVAVSVAAALAAVLHLRRSVDDVRPDDGVDVGDAVHERSLAPRPVDSRGPSAVADASRSRIRGVVRRGGVPVAADVVAYAVPVGRRADDRASLSSLRPDARAAAGADGAFVIDVVAPSHVRLLATDASGGQGTAFATLVRPGLVVERDIPLIVGSEALVGRAVLPDRTPFRGTIDVRPGWPGAASISLAFVATADDGTFRVEGLPSGALRAVAWASGRLVAEAYVLLPRAEEWLFVVHESVEIAGRIVDAETSSGIAGAKIAIDWTERSTTSESNGRFRIAVPSRFAHWTVVANGYAESRMGRYPPPGDGSFEIRLVRGGTVSGRVVTEDGRGVANLTVDAIGSGIAVASVRSDADGHFLFAPVLVGRLAIMAYGRGWATRGILESEDGAGPFRVEARPRRADSLDVVVEPTAGVSGTVTADAGAVAGALVVAHVLTARGERDHRFHSLQGPWATSTASDGSFTLDALVPGASYELEATAPDGATARHGPLRADAGSRPPVVLRIELPRWTAVRCMTPDGKPVPGASVTAGRRDARGTFRTTEPVFADVEGRARIESVDGPITLVFASADGYVDARSEASPGETTLVLTAENPLHGWVRWEDGTPASDVEIVAMTNDDESSRQSTNERGSFAFPPSTDEVVELRAIADGGTEITVRPSPAGEPTEIVLKGRAPTARRASLRVSTADGRSVPRVNVHVKAADRDLGIYVSDGVAKVAALTGDTWFLAFNALGSAAEPVDGGAALLGPFPAGTDPVELRLPSARTISGVVRDTEGHAVAGALVGAVAPRQERFDVVPTSSAYTMPDGRFSVGGLGPWPHSLNVQAPDLEPFVAMDGVPAGTSDLEIVVSRRPTQRVLILAHDGLPVDAARLDASGFDRPSYSETDEHGRAVIHRWRSAARTKLTVTPPTARLDLGPLTVDPLPFGDLTLRLPRALTVRGVVRDAHGAPVAHALVDVVKTTSPGDSHPTVHTGPDGSFVVGHLPEGDVELVARRVEPPMAGVETPARAGATDVALVVERTTSWDVTIEDCPDDATSTSYKVLDERRVEKFQGSSADLRHLEIDGLRPSGRYGLRVLVERAEGQLLVASRTAIPGDARAFSISLMPARSVSGRMTLVRGAFDAIVSAGDGSFWVWGPVAADGSFVIRGLGAGRWTVTGYFRVGPATWMASKDVEAGDAVDLEPRPPR